MGLLSWIPGFDALTGQAGVDAANAASKRQNALAKEYLAMVKQVFAGALAAIGQARSTGVFDAPQIRKGVSRNVTNLIQGVTIQGLLEGAKEGDTVQSEQIAQSAIAGGRALEDVDFVALQREMDALGQLSAIASGTGQATQMGINTEQGGYANIMNAQNAMNQRIGQLAFLGSKFMNAGAPRFGGGGGGSSTLSGWVVP